MNQKTFKRFYSNIWRGPAFFVGDYLLIHVFTFIVAKQKLQRATCDVNAVLSPWRILQRHAKYEP